jgi:methionine synthase II (cobalamin-independent)
MQTYILFFPRIGRNRELKKVLEGYWKGELSEGQLRNTVDELKNGIWKIQHGTGLSFVTVGDFSFCDYVFVEDKQSIIERIREATDYLPVNQLCLSPQCGFASTEEGNLLTEEEQWTKIAFIKEIAESIWK